MPALSVITVVKDDPLGLERTVTSLRHQGPVDAELIVIDGSTQSVQVESPALFPTLIIQQPPGGIYPAMNAGLARATGRYVYFLNAGDTLADDQVLTRMLDGLRDAEFPVWAFGSVRFTDRNGKHLHEDTWDYSVERAHHFARGVFPPHQGVVAQTLVLRELNGFDTSYQITADYALMLTLSQCADPIRWPWMVAVFQQGGASSKHWWLAQREFHRARREILRPQGWARIREKAHTARSSVRTIGSRVVSNMSS